MPSSVVTMGEVTVERYCRTLADRPARRAALRGGPDGAVDAGREPHEVAPRAHDVVLEAFVLGPHHPGYDVFDRRYGYLFNSYYE